MLATTEPARRVIASGAAAMASCVTLVVGAYWFATVVGSSVGGLDISIGRLTAACLSLWSLGLAVGAIAFAAGAASGSRGVALGAGSVVAIGSYLAYTLLPLLDALAPGRYLSLWYPYADHQPLWNGVELTPHVVLLSIAGIAVTLGVHKFQQRDIA